MNTKLIRITTVPMALRYLLPGQMRFMSEHGYEVLMISAAGKELAEVIRQEGCRHIIVPMTRSITPFQDLKCLFQLIKIFRKERPGIVHTHTPKAGLLGMLAARFAGIKIRIHTVAGLPLMVESGFRYQLLKWIEKKTYGAATHVWPNSQSLLKFILAKKLAPASKLTVIGKGSSNGIDLQRFDRELLDNERMQQIKTAINFSSDKKYLLCIGRLVSDKGIVELVSVFSLLCKRDPTLRLLLVGQFEPKLDPLPDETINEISNNALITHIEWTDSVEYYLALADLFIFPSHREGFPNVLLQSAAMKLPIICSRIPGNIDIVKHHSTGLIFEKGNQVQLEELISFAIANPDELHKMAELLYQEVHEYYAREKIWQNILDAYKSLVH